MIQAWLITNMNPFLLSTYSLPSQIPRTTCTAPWEPWQSVLKSVLFCLEKEHYLFCLTHLIRFYPENTCCLLISLWSTEFWCLWPVTQCTSIDMLDNSSKLDRTRGFRIWASPQLHLQLFTQVLTFLLADTQVPACMCPESLFAFITIADVNGTACYYLWRTY